MFRDDVDADDDNKPWIIFYFYGFRERDLKWTSLDLCRVLSKIYVGS